MFDEIIRKAGEFYDAGEPFAIAVVVRYESPISGKPGDKAIIRADGSMVGWIGGGCTQPLVIREAQNAIRDGQPRLVRVTPTSSKDPLEGILEYQMSCHSGGTIDVYIEPVLPKPQIIILGKSPVAQALAQLGKVLHYHIHVLAPEVDSHLFPTADAISSKFDLGNRKRTPQTFVVVATQGQMDEEALEAALKMEAPYLAFVASRKKAEAVFEYLRAKGISDEKIARIQSPAGLDIHARLPEEIAVSILAEIIRRKQELSPVAPPADAPQAQKTAVDPVCKMTVNIATAKYVSEYEGEKYYFCCAGCRKTFEQNPEPYVAEPAGAALPVDPICGMTVDPETAQHHMEYKGKTYYFCCAGCRQMFEKQPQIYVKLAEQKE